MKPCRVLFIGVAMLLAGCAHQRPTAEVPAGRADETRASSPGASNLGSASLEAANDAFGRGEFGEAAEHYARAVKAGADSPLVHFRYGYSLHVSGHPQEALPHHIAATKINNQALRIDALYNVACANALMGRRDEALKYLERAIKAGFRDAAQVNKDADLDSLRHDAEFNGLIRKMGRTPRPVSMPA